MCTSTLLSTIAVSILVLLIRNVNYVQAMPRRTIRFRSKGLSSLPPFLTISPPRLTSPPKFHSDFDLSPFLMPSGPAHSMTMPSFERPNYEYGPLSSQSYVPPTSQSYGPPSSQSYGPPTSQSYGPPSSQSNRARPFQSYGTPAAEYGPPNSLKPMIHKHIYVHIPPPEPETTLTRTPLTTASPHKHYRIIFIKAPTIQSPTLPTIPLQPQDEEKTLVYVLVRKPEEIPELMLPKPASTTPSKPEVYFIRYQAQKESNDGPYPPSLYSSTSSSATLGPPLVAFGMKNNSIPK